MAIKKITELPAGDHLLTDSDQLVFVDVETNTTKRTTYGSVKTDIAGSVVFEDQVGIDSSVVVSIVNTQYIQTTGNISSMITNTVDAAYINNLVTTPESGFDSAGVSGIIADTVDSDYVNNLVNAPESSIDSSGVVGAITSTDLDMNGNKVIFSNVYSQLADLPSATDNHGMFAHVHATGEAYYAHAGNWVQLAKQSTVPAGHDSALVQGQIEDTVDSAYVNALVDEVETIDSANVQSIVNSTFASAPSLFPSDANATLGDSANPWKEVFVSGSSIHLGSIVLKEDTSGAEPQFKVVSESQPDKVLKVDLVKNSINDLGDVTLNSSLAENHLLMWDSDTSQWKNVELDLSVLEFQRTVDLTTETAPAIPETGDLYINTVSGTVDASWNGIGGTTANELQAAVWSAENSQWYLTTQVGTDGLTAVTSTTPSLKIDNSNPTEPSLSLVDASIDSDGLMSAGHFRKVETELDDDITALGTRLDGDINTIETRLDSEFVKKDINSSVNIVIDDTGSLRIKGHGSTSFAIQNDAGQDMLYSVGKDVRLANNNANTSTSLLNRSQGDSRYALSGHSHSGYATSGHSHSGYVGTTGNETISGTKTFSGTIDVRSGTARVVKSSSTSTSGCLYVSGGNLYWVP